MAHRLFNLELTANLKSVTFENIHIDSWNEVPGSFSSIRLVPNRKGLPQLTFDGLKIRKFYVGEKPVSMNCQIDNWRHKSTGAFKYARFALGRWSVFDSTEIPEELVSLAGLTNSWSWFGHAQPLWRHWAFFLIS